MKRGRTPLRLPAGYRHNLLTVLGPSPTVGRSSAFVVQCDCGVIKQMRSGDLKKCVSCGCHKKKGLHTTHGQTRSDTWKRWMSMLSRCRRDPRYVRDGVTVCARWDNRLGGSFQNFLADMGELPDKSLTIDRINPFGNYEPSNCRWADWTTQNTNKRKNYA